MEKADKAYRILPTNATPGVAELNSNFTTIIAPVNTNTEGDDCTPVECGSIGEVATNFKPTMEFEVKKLGNLGGEKVDETVTSITMRYGEESSQVMNDFNAESLAVKATSNEGDRVLLDQQLTHLTLEDLQERLRDQKFAELFQKNRNGLIQAIEGEIARLQKILEDQKLSGLS
jgi:hypothetical protein